MCVYNWSSPRDKVVFFFVEKSPRFFSFHYILRVWFRVSKRGTHTRKKKGKEDDDDEEEDEEEDEEDEDEDEEMIPFFLSFF